MLTQQYLFRMCVFMCFLLTRFHTLVSAIHWLSPIINPEIVFMWWLPHCVTWHQNIALTKSHTFPTSITMSFQEPEVNGTPLLTTSHVCQFDISSSSGPGAYAPDAPQPVGLLCNPTVLDVPNFATSPSPPCNPRDP